MLILKVFSQNYINMKEVYHKWNLEVVEGFPIF